MAVSRLSIYNGALRECQERRLASLSEDREPRRLLDDVWNDGDGLLRFVLSAKQWKFARRTVELTPDEDITPSFGYTNAYDQPTDFVRTCGLWSDEYGKTPLLSYQYEGGYWYTDDNPIYLSYVSDHADYGGDLTKWPANFVLWVETHLASMIAGRLTGSKANRNDLIKIAEMRLKTAANTDAMEGPTVFPPTGTWVRARTAGRLATNDRGSRSRLTG